MCSKFFLFWQCISMIFLNDASFTSHEFITVGILKYSIFHFYWDMITFVKKKIVKTFWKCTANKIQTRFLDNLSFLYSQISMSYEDSTIKRILKCLSLRTYRARSEIFGWNLVPISEYSSSWRFFKIEGKNHQYVVKVLNYKGRCFDLSVECGTFCRLCREAESLTGALPEQDSLPSEPQGGSRFQVFHPVSIWYGTDQEQHNA